MVRNAEQLTDEELIGIYQRGDTQVGEFLINKYKGLVRKKARLYYLEGGDQEDLLQEGMMGLFKAIREYDAGKGASFYTFAGLCINRQMLSAIEAAGRKKHQVLNESLSLEQLAETGDTACIGIVEEPGSILEKQESANRMLAALKKKLSPMEKEVLGLYLDGLDYLQIADSLGKSGKSIDNALQRIRRKSAGVLENG